MSVREKRGWTGAIALVLAIQLHAGALLLASKVPAARAPRLQQPRHTEVELWSSKLGELVSRAEQPEGIPQKQARTAPKRHPTLAASSVASSVDVEGELRAPPGVDRASTPAPRVRRRIDLGLDGAISLARVFDAPEQARRSRRPSPGLLREGLNQLDAQRGISRASPVIRAANRLALTKAPDVGIATFEIVSDSEGVVRSVRLVGTVTNRRLWEQLANALLAELRQSRLRVPAGSNGLLTRIRIERGELAKTPEERFRSERGAALGQEPSHPGAARNESTQASEDPGRLTPTLGGRIGAGDPPLTRIVLLFSEAY